MMSKWSLWSLRLSAKERQEDTAVEIGVNKYNVREICQEKCSQLQALVEYITALNYVSALGNARAKSEMHCRRDTRPKNPNC